MKCMSSEHRCVFSVIREHFNEMIAKISMKGEVRHMLGNAPLHCRSEKWPKIKSLRCLLADVRVTHSGSGDKNVFTPRCTFFLSLVY